MCCVCPCAGAMVVTMSWNDTANILCGIQDSQLCVWLDPGCVFTDKDLLPHTLVSKDARYTHTHHMYTCFYFLLVH